MQVVASRTSAAQIYLWTWQATGQSRARPDRVVRGVDGRTHRAGSAYARRAPAVAADQPVCQPRLPGVGRRGGGASGAGQCRSLPRGASPPRLTASLRLVGRGRRGAGAAIVVGAVEVEPNLSGKGRLDRRCALTNFSEAAEMV